MIVQYQTPGKTSEAIGPYPFKISADRVTDENAAMSAANGASGTPPAGKRVTEPNASMYDRIMNIPNALSAADFTGWVQERGLYFASEWDDHYAAPFMCSDPGESPKQGSLLIAQYGRGYYCYTGLSFFRELPAGVSGAFRLFGNVLELKRQ